jgi:hypothetical protein
MIQRVRVDLSWLLRACVRDIGLYTHRRKFKYINTTSKKTAAGSLPRKIYLQLLILKKRYRDRSSTYTLVYVYYWQFNNIEIKIEEKVKVLVYRAGP